MMQNIFNYPEFLENIRINDTDIAHAYDSLPSLKRAHMKNGIAFNHFLHKERITQHQSIVKDSSKGYMFSLKTEPVAWTVLFFTHTYLSAPRIIATLMPALLAKVPLVFAISLNGLPTNNALTALELMGIEDIFCMNNHSSSNQPDEALKIIQKDEALKVIKYLQEFKQNGRVLFMHNGELTTMVQSALEHNLIFWQENRPPKIAIQECSMDTKVYLSWAHSDAFCSDFNPNAQNNAKNVDALFCTQDFYKNNQNGLSEIELIIFEGMEGCWSHANLKPEFFQQRALTMGNSDL